ncbi:MULTISPECIES: GMC family oxidoreductase [Alphaproteobacteria]|uniref:GMC family oxidoreductase n=1 Tax=Alphaproteobacteria TaxID=28211 RepID=UPI003297E20C
MFIDGRKVPEGTVVETDLAIIGGGAAGITIAREMIGQGLSVTLIESGGFEFEPETQDLYEGESVGVGYPLTSSRLRYFGGSTNHWGGWCRPLEPIDFEKRDWVPYSGWPVTRADLDPFYVRACEVCQINSTAFDDAAAWEAKGKPMPLAGDEVITRFFLYSPPTRFGRKYRPDIERAKNIACYLHSNVLEIVPSENGGEVARLKVGTLSGARFTVKPKACVLATGGIENARMLLASNSVETAGLGNRNDVVGRFFMEHPHVPSPATFLVTDRDLLAEWYRTYTKMEGERGTTMIRGCLMFDEGYLRREKRLGTVMTFAPVRPVMAEPQPVPAGASEEERKQAERQAAEDETYRGILQLARSSNSSLPPSGEVGWRLGVGCASEQQPNPASRITLSDEKDALGMPRTRLDWRLKKEDADNLRANIEAVARAFGGWGEGRVQVHFPKRDEWTEAEGWGNHHLGSTRMAADPKLGVTNGDCRVHGISNLFIAGSSLFPTGATVNPTLTIVALALRLSDHLKRRFAQSAAVEQALP